MKKIGRIFTLMLVVLLMTACSGESSSEPETAKVKEGAKSAAVAGPGSNAFPLMSVTELDRYLKDNAGKPTMLFFWATWCPSCKQQIPELEKFRETNGDKVNLITLSLDDKVEALEKYVQKHPTALPIYWGDQALPRKFNVEAIPTMIIFDGTGKQVFMQAGIFPSSMLGAMADNLTK